MKCIFVLLLLLPAQGQAQNISARQAKKLSGEIAATIKKHSIYVDSLDIKAITQDVDKYADTFKTYKEVGYYYTRLLRKAGDNHSFYISQSSMENYSAKQKDSIGFSYRLLDGRIGYLNIPGFLSTNKAVTNNFANRIHDAVRELDTHNEITGWIVDLRQDDGGNMWPMVLGLAPLIGKETPGYFANSKRETAWKTGSPFNDITIKAPYQLKSAGNKTAVLYSNKTASSGEMTAVCFIGKPNSRSFGETTGGFITGNEVFYLSDGNIFVLATTYTLDRNKKKYTTGIAPDVPAKDALEEAVAWLKH